MEADNLIICRILLLVSVTPFVSSPPSLVSISRCFRFPGIRLPSDNIANKIMTPLIDIIVQSVLLKIN